MSFSDSPIHFETRSDELTEKKVPSPSVAHAFAKYDLPVPGGPYNRIPLHGFLVSSNNYGKRIGKITASYSASLAPSNPATSSQRTLGFSVTMALARAPESFSFSLSSSETLGLAATPVPPCGAYGSGLFIASCLGWMTVFLMYSARWMYSIILVL